MWDYTKKNADNSTHVTFYKPLCVTMCKNSLIHRVAHHTRLQLTLIVKQLDLKRVSRKFILLKHILHYTECYNNEWRIKVVFIKLMYLKLPHFNSTRKTKSTSIGTFLNLNIPALLQSIK